MKNRAFKFSALFVFVFVFSFVKCSKFDPISSPDNETCLLRFNFANIPTKVVKIEVYLSREEFQTLVQVINISGQTAFCQFTNVIAGNWHIKAVAKSEADSVLYSGETDVNVTAGQTATVYLELKAVGNIDIYITWGEEEAYTYIYDFNDGDLTGWAGPANANIYQNALHLWCANGFKWHTISNVGTTHFSKGIIEFDILPKDGMCAFETKGASRSNSALNWGVNMRWIANSVFVQVYNNNDPVMINTHLTYEPDDWYHFKIEFDSNQDTKGKYSLWMKNVARDEDYKFGGEYDYYAQYGPLIGVNQISLGVYDPQTPRVVEKHVYFDNFYFKVSL